MSDNKKCNCKYAASNGGNACAPGRCRRPDEATDPAGFVSALAYAVLQIAEKHNLVVTIEQQPLRPLAMGHYEAVVSVRPNRVAK